MKSLCSLILATLALVSPSPLKAQEIQHLGDKIFDIYQLHTQVKATEDIPIPSVTIYDLLNERFLSKEQAIELVLGNNDLGEIQDMTTNIFITPKLPNVKKEKVMSHLFKSKLKADYLVFYHNIGEDMLKLFPNQKTSTQMEHQLKAILTADDKFKVYTIW
ncbi:hypothetical protein [Thalassotalea fusca]